jgi:hypothetical protein
MNKNIDKPFSDVEKKQKNKKITLVYDEDNLRYISADYRELGKISEQKVQEIMDEFGEKSERFARIVAVARQNPGEWLETNYWVNFRNGATGEKEEYDWDYLVKNDIETGETAQGYLCIRSTKEN